MTGDVLVLGDSDVEALLDLGSCIDTLAEAMAGMARGDYFQPLRMKAQSADLDNRMVFMPARLAGDQPVWGVKSIVVSPLNANRGIDSHQGVVLLHDGDTGVLRAIVGAAAITAARTAAMSALACRTLARPDVATVALLGAGVQGRVHAEALRVVYPDAEIRIWSRSDGPARQVAGLVDGRAVGDVRGAIVGADVICTVTRAATPLFGLADLAAGAHITAAGSSIPTTRELDAATVAASAFFVDRRESAVNESGEYLAALREGAIEGPDHVAAEIGEVLAGLHPGRTGADQLTVYKSLGLGVQDVAAARLVVERARTLGVGTTIDW